MKHEKTHPTDAGTQTYPGLNTYVPIVKSASRAQLEMETCRSEAIVANNFVSGMVSWFAATLSLLPYVRRRGPIFMRSGTHPDQAQKTERKSMPDHAMARKVNASDAREFCNERPTKKRKSWLPARITFAQRKTLKRTSAGFVPKPLRNCSPRNLETSLLEPTEKKEV